MNCLHQVLEVLRTLLENLVDPNVKAQAVQSVWQSIVGMALKVVLGIACSYFSVCTLMA